jgi:hypothetical protein
MASMKQGMGLASSSDKNVHQARATRLVARIDRSRFAPPVFRDIGSALGLLPSGERCLRDPHVRTPSRQVH